MRIITMIPYLKGVINDFPEVITGRATSPASEHLFMIREDTERVLLEEARAIDFHHTVAQLLFACPRARKDIQTAVAFLTTRVRSRDEDDCLKLKRVSRYISSTIYLPLILRADNLNVIKWWVDASFATHENYRGQPGGTMSLGKGSMTSMSKKQKINTRSSTECELVAADDALAQVMWTYYFMEAQGHEINENILFQDNMSTMLLEKNGKQSISKRTKHIRVIYFFIKDRVDSNDLTIKHCPTEEMLADHFTKPLQGTFFRKFRADIQGIPVDLNDTDLGWDQKELCEDKTGFSSDPSPQECVGKETLVTRRGNPKGIFGGKTIVPIVSDSKTAKAENPKGILWDAGANIMNPKDAFGANTLVPMANNIGVRKTYAQVARVNTNYARTAARNARIDFEQRSRDR
jgi:hypothetical protein